MPVAGEPTRVLILDDVPSDAALVERELRRGGLDVITLWVETEPEFVAALVDFKPDIVLSDYSLPSFNGMDALKLVQQHSPTTPLIIVTGSLTEEAAAECIKAGAADYVLKERLARLLPAVRAALDRRLLEGDKRRAEEALRESEERYHLIFDKSLDALLLTAPDGRIFAANPAACRMFGREEREICELGRNGVIDATDPRLAAALEVRARTGSFSGELTGLRSDGARFPIEVNTSLFEDRAGNPRTSMIIRDVSEQRRAEAALLESENQLRAMFELASIGIAQADPRTGRWVRVNQKLCAITGYTAEELLGLRVPDITHPDDRKEDWEAFQRVVKGETPDYRLEKRYVRKDASVVWVNVNMTVLRDGGGQPARTIATIEDITERKRTEEALRQSEARFKASFASSPIGMALVALDGRYLEVNSAHCQIVGYSEGELQAKTFQDLTHPDDLDLDLAQVRQLLAGEVPTYQMEKRYLHKQGQVVWVLLSVALVRDRAGQPLYFVSQVEDITERERAVKALRASEEHYRLIADNAADVIWALDLATRRFTYMSPSIERLCGFTAEEMLARPFEAGLTPDSARRVEANLAATIAAIAAGDQSATTGTIEADMPTKDGGIVHTEIVATALTDASGRVTGLLGVTRDVTERKQGEQMLRLRDSALAAAANAIVITDTEGRIEWANPAFTRLTGYDLVEVRGQGLRFLNSGVQDRAFYEQLWLTIKSGSVWHGEIVNRRRDGTLYSEEMTITPVRETPGAITHFIAVKHDVTEKRRAEEVLLASEVRYRRLFEAARDGILILDAKTGAVVDVNPFLIDLLICPREEFVGRKVWDLGFFADVAANQAKFEELQRKEYIRYEELPLATRDGRRVHVEFISNVYLVDGRKVIQCNIRDNSERKLLEAQLRQSQKMEAVGQLAGGVAHDFNNLLQAMLSLTQMLVGHLSDPERLKTDVAEMEQQVRRGAALTRQLLLFSRRETVRPERLDLNEVVRDGLTLLRRLLKAHIAIETRMAEGHLPVEGDRGQLGQVLLNLAVNAADAMPAGGRLRIETGSEDGAVWLKIADTGSGIPAAIRDHVFDPFFTTKGQGKGTGLGLSVVHGIVTKHGGTVTFECPEGQGTTFAVTLPRAGSGEHPAVEIAVRGDESPRGRGEQVLLVEDEGSARQALAEMLSVLGYTVTAVGSGEEAGRLSQALSFDLLLTDLMLPGISGSELAVGLQARWPDLRVVLMSGYAEDEAIRLAARAGVVRFLEKPFDMDTLARELHAALEPA
jgi:two-component system, cell cycle sensor histidine kinase and response regulator CckA